MLSVSHPPRLLPDNDSKLRGCHRACTIHVYRHGSRSPRLWERGPKPKMEVSFAAVSGFQRAKRGAELPEKSPQLEDPNCAVSPNQRGYGDCGAAREYGRPLRQPRRSRDL